MTTRLTTMHAQAQALIARISTEPDVRIKDSLRRNLLRLRFAFLDAWCAQGRALADAPPLTVPLAPPAPAPRSAPRRTATRPTSAQDVPAGFISLTQAARLVGLHVQTLHKWLRDDTDYKHVTVFVTGRFVWVNEAEVRKAAQAQIPAGWCTVSEVAAARGMSISRISKRLSRSWRDVPTRRVGHNVYIDVSYLKEKERHAGSL